MTAKYSTLTFYKPNRSERSQKNLAHVKPQKSTFFFILSKSGDENGENALK